MVHGANTVTLSKETESNRENKPAPKVTKAHIYSTNVHNFHRNRLMGPPGPDFLKTGTVYPDHKIHNNFFVTRFLIHDV